MSGRRQIRLVLILLATLVIANGCKGYDCPSGFRKGVRDNVWGAAVEASTGCVLDPQTGRFMAKDQPWDMGHKTGYEFRKHKAIDQKRQICKTNSWMSVMMLSTRCVHQRNAYG